MRERRYPEQWKIPDDNNATDRPYNQRYNKCAQIDELQSTNAVKPQSSFFQKVAHADLATQLQAYH